MNRYRIPPLSLSKVKTYPLAKRSSKIKVDDFAVPLSPAASVGKFIDNLPNILAGKNLRAVAKSIVVARNKRKPIIWGLGGHVIKCGLGPVIIDLMRRGYVSCLAMNGAAMIHDFEVAWVGHTSEDVEANLGKGQFGMAEETSRTINGAIATGVAQGIGAGEAVGRVLVQALSGSARQIPRFPKASILTTAYQKKIPVTVHLAIGTDINTNHPSVNAGALGSASHQDFRLLARMVSKMGGGGVYLNLGSAVILPEVFLKCVSLTQNLGRSLKQIVTVNFDFIQHYRPTQNVVLRPTINAGTGYALTGHHELMIPLLAAAILEADRKKRAKRPGGK